MWSCPKSQKNTATSRPAESRILTISLPGSLLTRNTLVSGTGADWKQKFGRVETKYKKSKSPGQFKIKNIYLFFFRREHYCEYFECINKTSSRKTPTAPTGKTSLRSYLRYSLLSVASLVGNLWIVRVYIQTNAD